MEIAEGQGQRHGAPARLALAGQEEVLMARFDNQVGEMYNRCSLREENRNPLTPTLPRSARESTGSSVLLSLGPLYDCVRVRAELLRREGRAAQMKWVTWE